MLIGFKNKAADASLTAKLVSLWTRSPWVHCELVFEAWGNLCVSARPGEVAVSGRPFREVVTDLTHWEFYRVGGLDSAEAERAILLYLFAQSVTEYSYSGIIWSQVFGADRQVNGQWFGSELAYQVLWNYSDLSTTFTAPASWSPAELRALIMGSCVKIDLSSV